MGAHFGYLFAAYSIIFVAMFLYVMFIWRRQAALDAELRTLEARVAALTEHSAAGRPPEPRSGA
ncbi:MAG: CcmD family protein [Candidatus Binatus sp.]|jgi:CcmD family protein|uniref:CcmD family protein n=1 Tax=Candidatus Binatus sp. TaxID=2811406 RepID=UPI003C747147